jgi:hypothetical protein
MAYIGPRNQINGYAGINGSGVIENSVLPSNIDVTLLADGSVTNTEFQYLDGATSNIQVQIDNIVAGGVVFEANYMAIANVNIANPGTNVFDGQTVSIGDTIFLLGTASSGAQTDAAEGGIYTFNGNAVAMTRISTMNTWNAVRGCKVYINNSAGSKALTSYVNTNNVGGTLDVTPITFAQIQDSYIGIAGITVSGNQISIDATYDVTFNSVIATDNTLGVTLGSTTNTASIVAPTLTGARTVSLPDANSNTVIPATALTVNDFVSGISSGGVLAYADVIDALLTGYLAQGANVLATDTILEAFNKLGAYAYESVTSIAITSSLSATDTKVQVTANGVTLTLPDATTLVIGKVYNVKLTSVATSVILDGFSTQTIDGNLTFTLSGLFNGVGYYTDGSNIFLC